MIGHTLSYTVSNFEVNQTDSSWDIDIFVSSPCFSHSDHYQTPSTWDMASEPTPQQLITQSAQATADAIASALTARTASISLPVYDWDSQDAYDSFSIFCCTLENWLLLNHILPDSEDHLRYVFADLGSKSLEMHAQWMPTGSKEEQKVTKAKASAFLNRIQQGMTHNVNTHVCLGELEEIVAILGEDPQDLVAHIKTLMDCCEMINDEHHEHELHCHIICAYRHEGKLLGKLMAKPFKTPSNELADIAVNHFNIQDAREQVSHTSKPVDIICQDKRWMVHTSHNSNGHTPSAPSKDCPNCTQQHPAGRANCPACDSHCSKCDKMGHWGPKCHGGKPLQPRNASPPGSQQRKSRFPPRNHNNCLGWSNKTDTIDVSEDQSPQDEIALHYIQPNVTVQNTHPKEIMVGDVCAPQCKEAYTTIQLPASASRKGTASLYDKVNTRAGGNVLRLHVFQCLYPDHISPAGLPTGLDHVSMLMTHHLQWIPYTPIWCTPWAHHLTARLPWHSTLQGKLVLVHCKYPWSCHPASTLKWETGSHEDELCHHSHATWHTSCTCFHYSGHNQACYSPWNSQVHQVHWWLDQGVPGSVQGNWQIPWWIPDLTPSWCTSCDTCTQEMPHCLTSKGQGAPLQDGMPRCDHPCRWTNGLGILHYLHPEGKWQATSVPRSLEPQWGHLLWSSQDVNCGGSCSWVCTLLLLH